MKKQRRKHAAEFEIHPVMVGNCKQPNSFYEFVPDFTTHECLLIKILYQLGYLHVFIFSLKSFFDMR